MRQRYIPSNPEHDKLVKLRWSSVSRLLKLALPYRLHLTIAAVLTLLTSAVKLSVPVFGRIGVDRVVSSKSVSSVDTLALIVMGLFVLGATINFAQSLLIAY